MSLCLLTLGSASHARLDQPHTVEEPAYGEVAYLYLKGDYFAALTRAQMALERGEVVVHRPQLNVLLGALYSAYGMPEDAAAVFDTQLDEQVSDGLALRAWIHLAGLFYRQQKYQQALDTLDTYVGTPPPELDEVFNDLRARILMRLGEYEAAAKALDAIAENHPLNVYLRYNLAISHINGDHPGIGQQWLWELANLPAGDAEINAVKEKSMLALAIYMLRSDQEHRVIPLLKDARLSGPFADVSLLLYARALLLEGKTLEALPVLQTLDSHSIQKSAVQEAQLALPYLYEQVGQLPEAKRAFETAQTRFSALQSYLQRVDATVASGEWFALMVGEPQWSTAMDPLPSFLPQRVNSFPTFYQWFASNEFQHGWSQYHQLLRQQNLLNVWQYNMPALHSLLEAHEYKHASLRPQAKALLDELSEQDLQGRLTRLTGRFADAVTQQDPQPFATPRDERLWSAWQEADARAQTWGDNARPDLKEKLDFYQGVLLWEMQEDIVPRQWEREREIKELEQQLAVTGELRSRVHYAAHRVERLAYFRQALPELAQQLAALQQRASVLLQRQQQALEVAAQAQLAQSQQRVLRYRAAAHEGLADLYHRVLRERRAFAPAPDVDPLSD